VTKVTDIYCIRSGKIDFTVSGPAVNLNDLKNEPRCGQQNIIDFCYA